MLTYIDWGGVVLHIISVCKVTDDWWWNKTVLITSIIDGSLYYLTSPRECFTILCNLFNSLVPGRSWCDFKNEIFSLVLLIGIFRSCYDNALGWIPWDLTDDKSAFIQVMAWYCQAASHFICPCWASAMLPYGFTKPQWVNWLFIRLLIRWLYVHNDGSAVWCD